VKLEKCLKITLMFACCFVLAGCAVINDLTLDRPPYNSQLNSGYNLTILKFSNSTDVLGTIHQPDYALLSQSESIVASCGEKKKGLLTWLNMVAFDENKLTAKRKYFFMIDEKPKGYMLRRQKKMQFDTEMVVDKEIISKPYANGNARRIGILRHVLSNFHDDIRQLRADNKQLDACSMVVGRTFEGILYFLDNSPQFASKLNDLEGMDFDHINLGKGKIRLIIRRDIVKVKIKIGSIIRNFANQQDVIDM